MTTNSRSSEEMSSVAKDFLFSSETSALKSNGTSVQYCTVLVLHLTSKMAVSTMVSRDAGVTRCVCEASLAKAPEAPGACLDQAQASLFFTSFDEVYHK